MDGQLGQKQLITILLTFPKKSIIIIIEKRKERENMKRTKKYNHLAKLTRDFVNKECTIQYGNCFAYHPQEKTITFSLGADDAEDCHEWKEFLAKKFNFSLTKENIFTLSILHELGHHFTIELFSDDEWNFQATEEYLRNINDYHERSQAYFNMPIELLATQFAIDIYRNHPRKMRAWNHRFTCAIRHLEKKENKKFLTNF